MRGDCLDGEPAGAEFRSGRLRGRVGGERFGLQPPDHGGGGHLPRFFPDDLFCVGGGLCGCAVFPPALADAAGGSGRDSGDQGRGADAGGPVGRSAHAGCPFIRNRAVRGGGICGGGGQQGGRFGAVEPVGGANAAD